MHHNNHNLILAEDDTSLGYLLTEYLQLKGFKVTWAQTGEQCVKALEKNTYDLAILDIMLPDMDGFDLAEKLKFSSPNLPFIFLTARSLKVDVLKGFAAGAVDYLKKPIDEEELVARIEALLSRIIKPQVTTIEKKNFSIGKYEFNPATQELTFEGDSVHLTSRESDLLKHLALNKNKLCTDKDILNKIWGKNDYFNKKSLNVFVSRLRKYLSKDPDIKIENLHKRGFILRTE